MASVQLAFCIYAENPYGDSEKLVEDDRFRAVLDAAVEAGERINHSFGHTPRTYFCTGSHLEVMELYAGKRTVKRLYHPPRTEIGNHTYSHAVLAPVQGLDGFYPRRALTHEQITKELQQTNEILQRIFHCKEPFGFSAPCGYSHPLPLSIAQAIKKGGCSYTHSYTRGPGGSLFSPLKDGNRVFRQPFSYSNGLLEIPLSGWQDVFNFPSWFTTLHRIRFRKKIPRTTQEILHWWRLFLEEAWQASKTVGDIFLTTMLHPSYAAGIPFIDRWGFQHKQQGYDPKLMLLREQLNLAKELGVKLTTMGEIARQC